MSHEVKIKNLRSDSMQSMFEGSTNGSSIQPKEAGPNLSKIKEQAYNWQKQMEQEMSDFEDEECY